MARCPHRPLQTPRKRCRARSGFEGGIRRSCRGSISPPRAQATRRPAQQEVEVSEGSWGLGSRLVGGSRATKQVGTAGPEVGSRRWKPVPLLRVQPQFPTTVPALALLHCPSLCRPGPRAGTHATRSPHALGAAEPGPPVGGLTGSVSCREAATSFGDKSFPTHIAGTPAISDWLTK